MAGSDLAGEPGTHAAVGVDDRQAAGNAAVALDGGHQFRINQQLIFQYQAIAMGHIPMLQPRAIGRRWDRSDQAGKIQGLGFD